MSARELPQWYIVVREDSNRIVGRTVGTHAIMERIVDRLDARHGTLFFYDDDSEARRYLPMDGAGLALSPQRHEAWR